MVTTKPDDSRVAQATAAQAGEVARLREENEQLRAELRREHEMYVRNLADFDSFHRRAERERAQAAQAGKRDLILGLLGVLDDFEGALRGAGGEAGGEAVRGAYRRLASLLEAEGVTPFESAGRRFDPARHEAVAFAESAGGESGVVVDEIRRGYRWGAELLRPAQVRVAQ
jgi:molecular chaperone GrpE